MGLFDLFKNKKPAVSGKITNEKVKRNVGVVFVCKGSKVYHCDFGGCSISCDAAEMTEQKAISLGLHRCKRCDWYYFDMENKK